MGVGHCAGKVVQPVLSSHLKDALVYAKSFMNIEKFAQRLIYSPLLSDDEVLQELPLDTKF